MIATNFNKKIISPFLTSIFTLMIFSHTAYSWVWVSSELSDSEVESWIASIKDIPKKKLEGFFIEEMMEVIVVYLLIVRKIINF